MSVTAMQQGMPQHIRARAITSTALSSPTASVQYDPISSAWNAWEGMQWRIQKIIGRRAAKEIEKYENRHRKGKAAPNNVVILKACST
jgi:hypothetical protein